MSALLWPRTKDPDEVVDYGVNWAPHLDGDTIVSSQWIVPSGITKNSDSNTATATIIWLSSGVIGETYEFVNRIVTAGLRTFDRTIKLKCRVR